MEDNQIEATAEGIGAFIVRRASEVWEEKQGPYLLSNIDPELKRQGVDYKLIIPSGMTLRQFVSTLEENLRIVVHPIHKAKIGVVPKDSPFTFVAEPGVGPLHAATDRPRRSRQSSRRNAVMQFLSAVSELSEDEQKSVVIPTHILTKLMEDKS